MRIVIFVYTLCVCAILEAGEPVAFCPRVVHEDDFIDRFIGLAFSNDDQVISFDKDIWTFGYPITLGPIDSSRKMAASQHALVVEYTRPMVWRQLQHIGREPRKRVSFAWVTVDQDRRNLVVDPDNYSIMEGAPPEIIATIADGESNCEYWIRDFNINNVESTAIVSLTVITETTSAKDLLMCRIKSLLAYSGYKNLDDAISDDFARPIDPARPSLGVNPSDFAEFLMIAPFHPLIPFDDQVTKANARAALSEYINRECR